MPRFYFDTDDGVTDRDDDGAELADVAAARDEACRYLADILRHAPQKLWDTGLLQIIVQDERRTALFMLDLSVVRGPAMP
jgi:hypothetical protein